MREWPEPVRRVGAFLREAGAEARIDEFTGGTLTAVEAAQAVGCTLAQIVKSLVFDCDGKVVVVLVPGDRRADPRKIAAAVGAETAAVAGRGDVERATGFAPGAVSPFALGAVHDVLVDRRVLLEDVVWVGAGSPTHLAGVAPAELVRLARARTVDAVEGGD